MITKLGQNGKTNSRILIVLMMLLLFIFLATPSALSAEKNSCNDKCTKYEKVTDNTYQNQRIIVIYSFIVGGVKQNLYAKFIQECEDGHYSRTCTPFERCKVNKLCEQSGPIITETKGNWEECSEWEIAEVWVDTA